MVSELLYSKDYYRTLDTRDLAIWQKEGWIVVYMCVCFPSFESNNDKFWRFVGILRDDCQDNDCVLCTKLRAASKFFQLGWPSCQTLRNRLNLTLGESFIGNQLDIVRCDKNWRVKFHIGQFWSGNNRKAIVE